MLCYVMLYVMTVNKAACVSELLKLCRHCVICLSCRQQSHLALKPDFPIFLVEYILTVVLIVLNLQIQP